MATSLITISSNNTRYPTKLYTILNLNKETGNIKKIATRVVFEENQDILLSESKYTLGGYFLFYDGKGDMPYISIEYIPFTLPGLFTLKPLENIFYIKKSFYKSNPLAFVNISNRRNIDIKEKDLEQFILFFNDVVFYINLEIVLFEEKHNNVINILFKKCFSYVTQLHVK